MKKNIYWLLTGFFIVFILDGLSKYWVDTTFTPFQPHPVLGEFFRLTLGYNTGMAFSLFDDSGILPFILTGGIILGGSIWVIIALRRGELSPITSLPIGMIAGGALGNFIDRLPDGRVTDFLDFGLGTWRFATFNLADTAIVTGVVFLMVVFLLEKDGSPVEAGYIEE